MVWGTREALWACKGRGLERNANSDKQLGELLSLPVDPVGTGPSLCPSWLCLFRGTEGQFCYQALTPALVILKRRRRPAPSGREGLGIWARRHSQLLGWAVRLALSSRKPLKRLPGRGLGCPYLALISIPTFVTQENLGVTLGLCGVKAGGHQQWTPHPSAQGQAPHWPQLGHGAEHRTDTLPPPGA